MANIMDGDLFIRGVLGMDDVRSPSIIADDQVEASAGIAASKLEHAHREVWAQESTATASAETRVIHVARGAGTLQDIQAGAVTPNSGGATVDIDLLKNGASVLSATITLTDTDSAYALVAGAFSDDSMAAGDVFEIDVTVAAGGGTLAQGIFCYLDLDENYS